MQARPIDLRRVDLSDLTWAVEASWDYLTSYQGAIEVGNPALGQCWPTSRVVQWFYPEYEIAKGEVWTGSSIEQHFWNVNGDTHECKHLDLSWKQFPEQSVVRSFLVLDRNNLGDSERARRRCSILLERVLAHLEMSALVSGQ